MKRWVAMTLPTLLSAFDRHIRSEERVNSTAMVMQENLTEAQKPDKQTQFWTKAKTLITSK